MNKYLVIVIAAAGLGVLYFLEKHGGIGDWIRFEYRSRHFTSMYGEINGKLSREKGFKRVDAHLGKGGSDIIVEGLVGDQKDLDRLEEILKPFRKRAMIQVNVRIDPVVLKMPDQSIQPLKTQ